MSNIIVIIINKVIFKEVWGQNAHLSVFEWDLVSGWYFQINVCYPYLPLIISKCAPLSGYTFDIYNFFFWNDEIINSKIEIVRLGILITNIINT